MTLLELLKTCNHKMAVRIHFGSEDKYFDISDRSKDSFTDWLEWTGMCDSDYYESDVESWNVQQITFTKYDKTGQRTDEQHPVLFIRMK